MSEAELKAEVLKVAYQNGWIVFQMAMNRQRRPGKAASGYPDLTLARDGECLWIELKTQDGQQSAEQRVWQAALPAYHVIRPSDLQGRVLELLT